MRETKDMSYKILGVTLARGGSKGIPKKNIRALNNKHLIGYTIEAAIRSRVFEDYIVSTDSEEIAQISRSYGALIPFMRPSELAGDKVWSRDALKHAVVETESTFKKRYDYVVELPCVSPLRNETHIIEAVDKLIKTGSDSVISVCKMQDKHPVRMKRITSEDCLEDFCKEFPEGEGSRRQDLEPCYIRNGAIYAMTRRCIVEDFSRVGRVSRPYIMDEEHSVNIDSMIDFFTAEAILRSKGC